MIMDEEANILNVTSVPYPSYNPNPGWVQQNPENWVEAAAQAVHKSLACTGGEEIGIISLSGHMSGLVLVDREGTPLYPCITLGDSRSAGQSERLRQQAGTMIYASTGNPAIDAFLLPKLLWVKENLPEIYRQTQYVLFPKDYLRYRLTGRFAVDLTDAGNSLFFDVEKACWNESLLTALDLRCEILPDLLKPYDIAGSIISNAASLFGISEGIPVAAGAADMAAEAVGYGINEPGEIATTVGTCATILTVVPKIGSIGRDQITFHPHVVPGKVYALGSHFSGGMSLNWFSGIVSGDSSKADYALIQSLAQGAVNIAPGSEGLLYLPFLSGSGTPYFDPFARGAFLGLSTSTKRETMFHAILEGISYNFRESLQIFEAMGISIDSIRVGGGGMNISLWPSILADVFGHPVDVIQISDASTVGAAIIGGYAAGIFSDLVTPAQKIIGNKRIVLPDEKNVLLYERLFTLYQQSYQSLKPIF
jgi:xylulokinase